MQVNKAKCTDRTSLLENVDTSYSSLKYNMALLKTHSNDANCHRLAEILGFYTTKMQCAQDNQEDFSWIIKWV